MSYIFCILTFSSFCSFQDAQRLSEGILNLQRNYRIAHDQFNHLDFVWAKDNVELVNNPVIEFMKNF